MFENICAKMNSYFSLAEFWYSITYIAVLNIKKCHCSKILYTVNRFILLMKMKPKINFLSNILHEHPVFQYLIAIVKKRLTIEDANYLQQQTFAIFDNNQKLFMNI